MSSVTFVDHSEKIKEKLNRKLEACVRAAAVLLSDGYQTGLQKTIAPPHSRIGEIPHAYAGHKPRGFGPLNGYGEPNNTTELGFARDQQVGSDFLSNYIEGGASGDFGTVEGFVGFRPSHVASRAQNYLLRHDETGRPWVYPLFRENRSQMVIAAKTAFEGTE